jgi:hypothetical protein
VGIHFAGFTAIAGGGGDREEELDNLVNEMQIKLDALRDDGNVLLKKLYRHIGADVPADDELLT